MLVINMARPIKTLTDDEKIQVEALAQYLTKEQIADYFGMSRPTFDAVLERDEDVSLHYKRGKARAIHSVARNLVKKAMDGNMTAAIFYLKTQAGWRETVHVDNTSSDGSMSPSASSINLSELSDAELRTLNDIAKRHKESSS